MAAQYVRNSNVSVDNVGVAVKYSGNSNVGADDVVVAVSDILHSYNFIGLSLADIGMEFRLREHNGKKQNENLL